MISCPYCNALVSRPESTLGQSRVLCPRCGEQFAYREGVADEVAPADGDAIPESEITPTRRVSNRSIAFTVLAVMAVMAAVGLFYALQTKSIRREHDINIGKPQLITVPLLIKVASNLWVLGLFVLLLSTWSERLRARTQASPETSRRFRWLAGAAIVVVAVSLTINLLSGPIRRQSSQQPAVAESGIARVRTPAQLEALAHLPADVNLVVAVDVAEAMRTPTGNEFLNHLSLGSIRLGSKEIQQWTGLRWDAIDHIALGLKFDGVLIPQPTLVVHSRQPYDAAALLANLKAARIPESGQKDRYRVRWGSLEPVLWCPPQGQTLVYAMTPKQLDTAVNGAERGIDHFAAPLREVLQERLRQPLPVWLAGHSDHWEQTVLKAWLLALPQADQDLLMKIRTFGVWIQLDGQPTLSTAASCVDAAAAKELAAYLERWAQPPLVNPKVIADGTWVSGQARGTAKAVRQALRPTSAPDTDD